MPGIARKMLSGFAGPVIALASAVLWPDPCPAIVLSQIDDFQDGSSAGWSVNNGFINVPTAQDQGPVGTGDYALFMSTSDMRVSRLVVLNVAQWKGNWTGTGVKQVSLNVRNPNAFDLSMRLGIAGPSGQGPGGSGDTYVTDSITVAADDSWHALTFNVTSSAFHSTGGTDIVTALTDVTQFRVIHNPDDSYLGAFVEGAFYLDNIQAYPRGDYNRNGIVDAADFVVWRKTLSQTGVGFPADGTGASDTPDGVINSLDYTFWWSRFGNTSTGAGAPAAISAVPEPPSWVLVAFVGQVFRARSRRKLLLRNQVIRRFLVLDCFPRPGNGNFFKK